MRTPTQISLLTAVLGAAASVRADASSASFSINNLPNTWQSGQVGTNQCGQWGASSQDSMCQNVFVNSATDFCLWAPPQAGDTVGDDEAVMVSWCTRAGYGTRLIPDGTLASVHFVKTQTYVQVTGTGDFTQINIKAGDYGGELDPHGATGTGNPIGGLVFTNAFNGQYQQSHQWTNFMSATEYCFKACIDGPGAALQCNHVYDVQGCEWNMPANYGSGFEQCDGAPAQYPGIYVDGGYTSTFHQATNADDDDYVNTAPPPHPAPASSNCQAQPSPNVGLSASSPYTQTSGPNPSSSSAAVSSGSSGNSSPTSTSTSTPATTVTITTSTATSVPTTFITSTLLLPVSSASTLSSQSSGFTHTGSAARGPTAASVGGGRLMVFSVGAGALIATLAAMIV